MPHVKRSTAALWAGLLTLVLAGLIAALILQSAVTAGIDDAGSGVYRDYRYYLLGLVACGAAGLVGVVSFTVGVIGIGVRCGLADHSRELRLQSQDNASWPPRHEVAA